MAWATVFRRNEADEPSWFGGLTLTARILAVNIFALAMLTGGFFYIENYRDRLIGDHSTQDATEASMAAVALAAAPESAWPRLLAALDQADQSRMRLYVDAHSAPIDGWAHGPSTYRLRDPATEAWQRHVARFMDKAIDFITAADRPAPFAEPVPDRLGAWPEARAALAANDVRTAVRLAPERSPVISAAAPVPGHPGKVLLLTDNARDVIRTVRAERFWLGMVLLGTGLTSILLSLYLARTIARPLRRLAMAAHRVRLGRSREVQVPRLPQRRDEIGTLARALSDMSQALRKRIDATEAFAADVAHELKNPLASLRSAMDSLDIVTDPALKAQLVAIIKDDVHRLDRLISDISEASRLDAELSRARFETIDLGQMIEGLVAAREARGVPNDVRLAFARPHKGSTLVFGDDSRLVRVIENLVDNAVSFSPPGGLVQIAATRDRHQVMLRVEDEGPGVPPSARADIFNRFHSIRPEGEAFGRHSGLGLAIAKAIVEGHNGTIGVGDRGDAATGARFWVRLPIADR